MNLKNQKSLSKIESNLKTELKKNDPIELPMDEMFFDQLHDKIMSQVEESSIRPVSRWSKAWVFLEHKTRFYKPSNNHKTLQIVKMSFFGATVALGLSLGYSSLKLFEQSKTQQVVNHKQMIIKQALQNPEDWTRLAAAVQSESDFFNEIVNEHLSGQNGATLGQKLKEIKLGDLN